MMTHLILKDMVKVKGQVSEMAVLLIDPVPQIAALAKNFFNELSHKVREASWGFLQRKCISRTSARCSFLISSSLLQGNAIYNLLPDIISRLSDPEGGVEEEPFHTIMKYGFLDLEGGVCVCV